MSVFRVDIFYRCFFLAALAALAALAVCYRNEKVYILFLLTIILFVVLSVYAFTLKVETDGTELRKKTIFGGKKVNLKEVTDLSVMNLRGRYAFFFITDMSFVMISSSLNNFEALREAILQNLSENCRAALEKIPVGAAGKKARRFKIFLALLLFAVVGVLLWRSFNAGI
ncbi:MAG: hypothetical protein LBD73_01300 [Deferribacteraceae bacterium]|nr:hypothetical protein [Deferribacteraceae bacterium]